LIAWLVLGGGAPADPLALRPTGRGALGGALVLAGAAVRLWAMGYRTKTGHFAEDGPYRWVRHPLYGGTLLLWLGFFVLAGDVLWGGLLFACIFAGVHAPQAVFEEEVVCGLFGEAYEAYRRRVPRWLPVRRPRAPAGRPWSLRRMRRNRALLTLLQAAGTLLGFKLLLFWRG
jgi:protein-S-isoprenylcysteine O-methyltransferase Ste14